MAGNFDLLGLLSGASFAAGIAVLVVAAARLLVKKAPKRWSYIMWAVVFFRCLCPFAAESSVSIFNAFSFAGTAWTSETAETDGTANSPDVTVSEPAADNGYAPYAPSDTVQPPASEYIVNTESVRSEGYVPVQNDIQNVQNRQDIQNVHSDETEQSEQTEQPAAKNGTDSRTIFTIVWLCGVGAMALYGIVSAARLAARVKTAVRTEKGIYESDRISTAFAAGLLRPKIYIPCGIPEDERRLIVMHERVHIRRRDYLFKLLAFAGLSLHWFNPLIWAAFALMTRDMEMSCDEAVLKECGESGRILYAEALLRVSVRGFGGAAVVGFGETGIKERVKNVLNYKKQGKLAAVAAAVVMLASCTMAGTDAVTDKDNADTANGANAVNSAGAVAAHSGTMLEKGTTELSGSGGERFFFAYAEKLGETAYGKILPSSEKAGMPAIVFPDGSGGGVGFYEGDKPKLSASAEFRSDNNGSLSSCMSELTIGLDPEDTEEITVKGLKKIYKDELAFIEVDMDIRLKENAEPTQEFLEISGRGEFSSGFKDGVCSIKAEMEVSQNYFAHGITAEDLYGYGFVLCGFDNVPIYVSDGLEVVGHIDSSVVGTETVNFAITHEITGWTMEDLVNDVYLGGHKIVLPAHSNSLDPAFSLSGYYDRFFDNTVFMLSCNNEDVALISIDGDHSNDSDIVIDNIKFGINMPIPELNIMGITESSSSDEVKRILGEPNYIQDDGNTYRYVFSDKKQFMVSFTDDEKAIDFYYIQYEADDMEDGEQLRQKQGNTEWENLFGTELYTTDTETLETDSKLAEQNLRLQEEELRRLREEEESKLQKLREEEERLKEEAELRRQSEEWWHSLYDNHVYPAESADSAAVLVKPCPQEVKISALYGKDNDSSKLHKGIDYLAAKGTEVYAAADGRVIFSEYNANGYGVQIIIDHGGELATLYAHLDKALVSVDDEVKAGDLIGYSGHTGNTTGDALHFEVRENGQHVDPMNYFKI